ncbi:methyltransferase domain-containing protein [Serratia microhaemolytica]|uniref:methyltransferase domain-containing protein n=1 Tax=Serratia microhaemolytica TaxID=2675110 RepID=UPI000FDF01A5|nr:methyltransferase domain-containing protein [Serratia microhaemolytica]
MKSINTPSKSQIPSSWAEIAWGEYYRAALEQQLELWWPKLFGFHLLKLGNLSAELNTQGCPILHQMNVDVAGNKLHLCADSLRLPFAEKSIDACLLAHTLCYSHDPQLLLQQLDRVMINDGWLLISTFNPISLAAISQRLSIQQDKSCTGYHRVTQRALRHWLKQLNYQVMAQQCFHPKPWRAAIAGSGVSGLSIFGCLNLTVARKRMLPLTPVFGKVLSKKTPLGRAVGVNQRCEHEL